MHATAYLAVIVVICASSTGRVAGDDVIVTALSYVFELLHAGLFWSVHTRTSEIHAAGVRALLQ